MNLAQTYAYIKRMNGDVPKVTHELMYRLARCEVEQQRRALTENQMRLRETIIRNARHRLFHAWCYHFHWPETPWDARAAWRKAYADARREVTLGGHTVLMRYPNNPKQW